VFGANVPSNPLCVSTADVIALAVRVDGAPVHNAGGFAVTLVIVGVKPIPTVVVATLTQAGVTVLSVAIKV
jgi:hypothetical protein